MSLSLLQQRQIEQLSQRIVVQKRQERIFVNEEIIPRSPELVLGKRYYTYPILNIQGRAAIIANQSFDVPDVDAFLEERTQRIERVYQPWTLPFTDELEANAAGVGYRSIKIELAAQSMYNTFDDLGYSGVEELGMYGMANQPNALQYTLPNDGAGASTRFIDKTAEQILRDMMDIAYFSSETTRHAYNTTKIMLPPSAFKPLFTKTLTTSGVAETALTRFLVNQDYSTTTGIKKEDIIVAPGLEDAGPGGTPIAIAYNPRVDYIEYLRTPVQQRPLFDTVEGVKSALYAYAGAVLLRQPLSMVIVENI